MPKQSKNSASKDAENKKPKNPRKIDGGSGTSEGGEKSGVARQSTQIR